MCTTHLYSNNRTDDLKKICSIVLSYGEIPSRYTTDNNDDVENDSNSPELLLPKRLNLNNATDSNSLNVDGKSREFTGNVIVNLLLPDDDDLDGEEKKDNGGEDIFVNDGCDPWIHNAVHLYKSIQQMSSLLQQQKYAYSKILVLLKLSSTDDDDDDGANEDEEMEVSLLESSVTAFVASSASQMEALRQSLSIFEGLSSSSSTLNHMKQLQQQQQQQRINNRSGIVAILVSEMTNVMETFQQMQTIRNRKSLEMYEDPFKILRFQGGDSSKDSGSADAKAKGDIGLDDDDDDDGQDKVPAFSSFPTFTKEENNSDYLMNFWEKEEREFQQIYFDETNKNGNRNGADDITVRGCNDEKLLKDLNMALPTFAIKHNKNQASQETTEKKNSSTLIASTSANKKTQVEFSPKSMQNHQLPRKSQTSTMNNNNYVEEEEEKQQQQLEEHHIEELQRESAYLTSTIVNEQLEDVEKVEIQMTQITSLFSQFTNLISEQQEEINLIHDSTVRSRSNVEQGKEQLVDATERKKRSKHYSSIFIVLMGFVLLFLNWITP